MFMIMYSKGFAAGSIEGRVALEYFDELQNKPMLGLNSLFDLLPFKPAYRMGLTISSTQQITLMHPNLPLKTSLLSAIGNN